MDILGNVCPATSFVPNTQLFHVYNNAFHIICTYFTFIFIIILIYNCPLKFFKFHFKLIILIPLNNHIICAIDPKGEIKKLTSLSNCFKNNFVI